MYEEAILMDLSKAFDCLPHELLCEKLVAYGLDQNSVELIQNDLSSGNNVSKLEITEAVLWIYLGRTPGVNSGIKSGSNNL